MAAFDEFVYGVARDYGRWVYIAAVIAFLVIGTTLHNRSQKRRTFQIPLLDSAISQLGLIALVVAFAMQTGRFPVYLALASIVIGIIGWLVAMLLVVTDKASGGIGSSSERFRVSMAMVVGARLGVLGVLGIAQMIIGLGVIGVFIWGAFAHHPDRFSDGAFVAGRAIIFLTVPAAVSGLISLISTQMQVASAITPPGYRNLQFSLSVSQVISQSIMIFGPYIFMREEFEAFGIVLPSDTTVIVIGGLIVTAVLVIPYIIGFLGHANLERSLAKERREIFERAAELARWEDCDYKSDQVAALRTRILNQYGLLDRNVFLAYLGLELLLNFVSVDDEEEAKQRRELLSMSPLLGDVTKESLIEQKQFLRTKLAAMPEQIKGFFDIVDGNEWGDLIDASAVARHFYEIMQLLPRLEAGGASLEYVAKDLLADQKVSSSEVISQARPAIVFTLLSSALPQVWRLFGDDLINWMRINASFILRLFNVA
jgi:hypothetical protein